MKRIFYFLFLFIILTFFIPGKSFASSNFSSSYNVTYIISKDASTHVSFSGTLTNTTNQYYASAYQISVGFTNIYNVQASDPKGPITPRVTKTSQGNTIKLVFNDQVIGQGNSLNFRVSFDTNEVAQNLNHVFEINIPGASNNSDMENANTYVVYPSFLGSPSFVKPQLPLSQIQDNQSELHFTNSELGTSGISITFGNYQLYNFSLVYHLQNTNLFPIQTQIALPPSTNYQDILINDITPKPVNVNQDKDGNWLATYYLAGSQTMSVKVQGTVRLMLTPRVQPLDKNSYASYLKQQPYWQVNNPQIQSLAKSLKTPRAIYQYVVSHLSYDYSKAISASPRLGALSVLQNPNQAVCLEFSDLFVALARAAGIPSREIDGYGYTDNPKERPLSLSSDILHAWPEYYDKARQTWIMVDPTWGNTTEGVDYFNILDFDHFAFSIEGIQSDYPVPAGGYKIDNQKTKDVNISIGQSFNPKPLASIRSTLAKIQIAGLPLSGNIILNNIGNTFLVSRPIQISSDILAPKEQTLTMPSIPPFGTALIPISFLRLSILTNKEGTITISVGKNKFREKIRVIPFFLDQWFIAGGESLVIIITIIFVIAAKPRRISVSE